jgi:hypothetical protein
MKTKTWKIGEYAKGGVITVEIIGAEITIIGKEWDFSEGSTKSSNQSNAKEFTRKVQNILSFEGERRLDAFLNDLTTSYYADMIMKWIKSQI